MINEPLSSQQSAFSPQSMQAEDLQNPGHGKEVSRRAWAEYRDRTGHDKVTSQNQEALCGRKDHHAKGPGSNLADETNYIARR